MRSSKLNFPRYLTKNLLTNQFSIEIAKGFVAYNNVVRSFPLSDNKVDVYWTGFEQDFVQEYVDKML